MTQTNLYKCEVCFSLMKPNTSASAVVLTTLTEHDGVPGSYFEHDPSEYTVHQLKRWLKCRGLKQSGKRDDLIHRVSDCIRSRKHYFLDNSIDGGKWLAAKILRENSKRPQKDGDRERVTDIPVDPQPAEWKNFQSKDIPPHYNFGHIYHYALESVKYIAPTEDEDNRIDHMTDKPLKNARKYVESGFVHDVNDAKSRDNYFVRAHVWPSMRSDFPHNVSVILSNLSGAVIHASCEPCKVSALGRCSHIVAVLMFVLDHAEKSGYTASVACTSQPCSWNKGKKRNKYPKRLSDADYPSKRKKREGRLIDFDPRPKTHRKVTPNHINSLLQNLQRISTNSSNGRVRYMSMWETQLQMTYDDYSLGGEMVETLREKTKLLNKNLQPDKLMDIPGTQEQSSCEEWHSQRFRRLTASKCQIASKIGKLVCNEEPQAAARAYSFIKANVWNLDNTSTFQSYWMRYGIGSEPIAIKKYEEQTNSKVFQTGFWVNPKFPFLGCSPDGLVSDIGLVEIKSLKVFKNHTIEDITSGKVLLPKETINSQCFIIKDSKCVLRDNHEYYYQLQMQLLVTEREFCDFVLYAEKGKVSIERICRNEMVIAEILQNLTALWFRVLAPEIFEMRVPRGLHPFILPEAKQEARKHTAPDIESNPGYTKDEMDVAVILATTGFPGDKPCSSNKDLIVVPWGGVSSTGSQLVNTCPLDNWIMLFQALVKSNKINLANLTETGAIISRALQLIDNKQFGDAKIATLLTPPQDTNIISLYGNEDDFFIQLLRPYLCSKVTSRCNLSTCPKPVDIVNSYTVNLGIPANQMSSIFISSLSDWIEPSTSQCKRRFDSRPELTTPYIEDVVLDDNGNAHESWYCSGVREASERSLDNLKSFFLFSVDLLSRSGLLKLAQVPLSIVLNGKTYKLFGATLWNGLAHHYIAVFYYNNCWTLYDGLREYQNENSGLSFSNTIFTEPAGYTLSYLMFSI